MTPMRWFEESDEAARAVNFREVTSKVRPDLAWTRSGSSKVKSALDSASLRPPRVPKDMAPESYVGATLASEDELALNHEGDERDEVSGLHAAPVPPSGEQVMSEPVVPEKQDFDSLAPHERPRKDTMIDDIVPRAEEEAIAAIQKAVERAAADRDELNEASEDRLVDLALLIARRVIAREVSLDPKIVRNLVREGVSALGERDRLVVHVGSFFADMKEHLMSQLSNGKITCEVIVDHTLSATGCIVETDLGRVDESIETRLSNLIETLTFEARRKRK
jgi:hypothetical protein